jgi:quercetin dioxygenase-like cupin family protein
MNEENKSRTSMHIIRKDDLPLIGSSYNFVGAEHGNVEVSLFLVEAKPGRGAPLHCHDYDEIILVQEGSSRFVSGEETRVTFPGDILVVKAGTPHGFVNTGTGTLKQIDIHLSPHFKQTNLDPTEVSRAAGLPE